LSPALRSLKVSSVKGNITFLTITTLLARF
jgi:hypothetical protein